MMRGPYGHKRSPVILQKQSLTGLLDSFRRCNLRMPFRSFRNDLNKCRRNIGRSHQTYPRKFYHHPLLSGHSGHSSFDAGKIAVNNPYLVL